MLREVCRSHTRTPEPSREWPCANAVKFSPEGGDVTVRVRVVEGEVVTSVEDHGIGIPKAAQGRIFERKRRPTPGRAHRSVKRRAIGAQVACQAGFFGGTPSSRFIPAPAGSRSGRTRGPAPSPVGAAAFGAFASGDRGGGTGVMPASAMI